MNDIDDVESAADQRLRRALRDLRRDQLPQRDLWPQITARIAVPSAVAHASAMQNWRGRFVPWALAASLSLAIGLIWQLRPLQLRTGQDALIESEPPIANEAQAMTRAYRGALQELAASAPADVDANPALRELDRSAAQIRNALARDPDARFLLDRLRHTYSLRLALTRRAVLS